MRPKHDVVIPDIMTKATITGIDTYRYTFVTERGEELTLPAFDFRSICPMDVKFERVLPEKLSSGNGKLVSALVKFVDSKFQFLAVNSIMELLDDVDIDFGEDKYLPGDIDGTGDVSLNDVNALARYLSGWKESVEFDALDVNGDGAVNLKDLIYLSRYVAGWEGYVLY